MPTTPNQTEKTSAEAKWTPGPWRAREYKNDGGDIWIDCAAFTKAGRALGGTLATAHVTGCGAGSPEANARLIAAAPDLYEAGVEAERAFAYLLKFIQQRAPSIPNAEFEPARKALDKIAAALARARGEA